MDWSAEVVIMETYLSGLSPFTGRGSWRDMGTRTRKGNLETLERWILRSEKKYCFVKASGPIPAASSGLPESFKWKPWMPLLDWGPRSGTPPCPPGARKEAESSNGGGHRKAGLSESHQGELGWDEKVTYCSMADRLGNPTIFVSNNAVPISVGFRVYQSDLEIKVVVRKH